MAGAEFQSSLFDRPESRVPSRAETSSRTFVLGLFTQTLPANLSKVPILADSVFAATPVQALSGLIELNTLSGGWSARAKKIAACEICHRYWWPAGAIN